MFDINYVQILKDLPPELATFLISMIPIAELRVAIPVALGVYKLSVFSAMFWAVLGDIIPAILIVIYLPVISKWFSKRSKICKRFFDWQFARTRKKFEGKYARWGSLAIILFVGIPAPFTGSWTGAIAAFLFGIPPRISITLIFIGVILAGMIVSLLSLGVFNFFHIL
ncbi:small multi-drug export protein [Candidatus Falkowbacteria bacterium]|nr:small multi-drug export protein [Candidatus Falkowbacteria bacterium]